jgi:hypothetical protein
MSSGSGSVWRELRTGRHHTDSARRDYETGGQKR